ncbi:hypothetical protein SAMN05660464_0037 [Geodermatophilus dictyosporus]|uniref:Alpha/beta hydrolase n=1 Tax=Geodermatophilus dictyosporus TaxID=1523247 RepID=A0A1I5U2V8_9ACTN|nr:hypothetical protein [Geodermatophilus dictyosporus]SFP89589.1 hypothetical protein SAMN05660464_0037 [Geodermatophilus dictyosporus]
MVTLVLLHGVGGIESQERWLDPLNVRLSELGYPEIRTAFGDTIRTPSYAVAKAADPTEPPGTYQPLKGEALVRQTLEHTARQKELERFIRPFGDQCARGLRLLPDSVVDPVAEVGEFLRFPEVAAYMADRSARYSVWSQVLNQLPDEGRVIVVAHSLGSVVMADLLHRLPQGLKIDLLVTIGSPLGFARYRSNARLTKDLFPYSRVERWLNVAAPLDGVCGGRGLSAAVPQVIDLHADLSFTHAAAGYMSHPSVAAAVGYVAFGGAHRAASSGLTDARPSRRIHDSWDPLLLSTAFSLQISNGLHVNRWADKARLDTARREVAERVVLDIAARRRARDEQLAELQKMGADVSDSRLDDNPLADGRYPDHECLTRDAASLLNGKWRDEDLLSYAIGLMLLPVVPPFDIQFAMDVRREALESTMNLIRNRRGNLADKAFAQQVADSLKWAESRMAGGGFPWGTVLIATGVVLLAATGVGLAAAAPAGLAGAAIVTSTLAGFGPGGMVGGLITFGILTGTGASLASLGVADTLQDGEGAQAQRLAGQSASELAAAAPDSLTVMLTGMLAIVHAQLQLSFDSSEGLVRTTLMNALDIARGEWNVHEQVAPGSRVAKDWAAKVSRLERAVEALDSLSTEVSSAVSQVRQALESGRPPADTK